jgi:hypothetical protein
MHKNFETFFFVAILSATDEKSRSRFPGTIFSALRFGLEDPKPVLDPSTVMMDLDSGSKKET